MRNDEPARRRAPRSAPTRCIDPEGFAEHGPFDVVLELVGAPNLAGDLKALATGGRIVVIGIGGGAKAELNLGALMGKRATRARLDAAPAPAGGEGAHRARAWSATCCRSSSAARCACRSPPPSRSTRSREAYERFTAGGKLGKIVLELRVNAAERLWRGLARHDWEAVRAQFHPSAVIERAGDGTQLGVDEYVAAHRVARPRAARTRSRCCARWSTARPRSSRRAWASGAARASTTCTTAGSRGAIEYWA